MKYIDEKAKKLLLILAAIVGAMILLFIIFFIVGKISSGSLSYSKVENKMIEAAKSYYSKNKKLLPQNDGETVEVTTDTLVSENYMKSLDKYMKNETDSCTGRVIVTKSGTKYDYTSMLNCGNNYSTKKLLDKLLLDLTTNGDGLYQVNQYYDGTVQQTYIYRGEYPNNYISLAGKLWRVIKINADETITIIESTYEEKKDQLYYWDNRFNSHTQNNNGINDFEASRVKRKLDKLYEEKFAIPSEYSSKLVARKVCIGGRSIKDTANDGSIECSIMSEDKMYYSLLQANDFVNASLDKECVQVESQNCSNYNYLNKFGEVWWLLTANNKSYTKGYVAAGSVYRSTLSEKHVLRIVTNLNKNVTYSKGEGTKKNPYIIK